jgi:ankyrin repeat protein
MMLIRRITVAFLLVAVLVSGCHIRTRYDTIYDAIRAGDLRDVKAHLHNGTPIETTAGRDDGLTPLAFACRCGQPAITEFLLDRGADFVHQAFRFPLMEFASASGDTHTVDVLLAHGLEIWSVAWGKPVVAALRRGDSVMVHHLILRGAVVDSGDLSPLLFEAIRLAQWKAVSLLLAVGANPNAQEDHGNTALCLAVDYGQVHICSLLVAAGADPVLRCSYSDKTPWESAYYYKRQSIIDLWQRLNLPHR